MTFAPEIARRIGAYLDAVDACAGGRPADVRADLRRQLESHVCEALRRRAGDAPTAADLEAVLAEMDPPDSYGPADAEPAGIPGGSRACAAARGESSEASFGDEPWRRAADAQGRGRPRGERKWFLLAVCFLLLNGWAVWRLVGDRPTGARLASVAGALPPATPAAARLQPLRLLAASQAAYDGASRTAVLRLSFSAAPAAPQLGTAVRLSRDEAARIPVSWEPVGAIGSPEVLIRTAEPVESGDHLVVTVGRGLVAADGATPASDAEQRMLVPVVNAFRIGSLETRSPSFEPACVQVAFGKPVDLAEAAPFVSVQPPVRFDVASWWSGCTLAGDFQPGTRYTFTFRKGLRAADGSKLAEDAERQAVFPDRAAAVTIPAEGAYLSPQGSLNVPVLAVNVQACEVALRRLRPENVVFHANGLGGIGDLSDPAVTNLVRLPARPNREHKFYVNLRTLAGGRPAGVYGLDVTLRQPPPRPWYDDGRSERLVVVTDLGLSAKLGRDGVLAWVNSLAAGRPAGGAEVVLHARNNMELARGRADGDGLVFLPCRRDAPPEQQPSLVIARLGDDLSYLKIGGIAVEGTQGDPYLGEGGCEAFLYADRGIYRPGETAYIEALVRDGRLEPPAPFPVLLRVCRPDGRVFRDLPATLSPRGAAGFSVELPPYLPTGRYDVQLVMPGTFRPLGRVGLALEEFVPPQIAVALDPLPARTNAGAKIEARVSARHLFGRPAAGLVASADVYLHDAPFRPDGFRGYTFGDAEKPSFRRSVPLGETRLDADGRAVFAIPPAGAVRPAGALRATLSATVQDSGGRPVSGHASTFVDAYPFYVGLRPEGGGRRAAVGRPFALDVAAVAPDGRAFQPDAPLLAAVERVEWTSVLRRENGRYAWQSERAKIKVGEPSKVALRDGAGTFAFTAPLAGEYVVTLADPFSGASSSLSLHAAAAGTQWVDWDRSQPARAKLVLDRESYAPGQKARLAVQAPFAGTALLTVESDRVLERRVVTLDGNAAEFELDVLPGYAPNVHCLLSVIRPAVAESVWTAHRAIGAATLRVAPPGHRLTVALDAPPRVRPQGPLAATVRVTDEAGAPVAGAEIRAMAVDEGICMLTDHAAPDPLAHFLRTRGLGVVFDDLYGELLPVSGDTADATVSHVGGDAGAMVGRRLNPIRTRRFRPVALWHAGATTGADGAARLAFDVPEFAGELRLTAVAFTASAFGAAKRAVTVKRPLVVQAELPRFLAPGDACRLALAVFNETNAALEASWRVTCGGPLQAAAAEGGFVLPARAGTNVPVMLRAGPLPGRALCAVEVTAGDERYAETIELAVRPILAAETRLADGPLKAGESARIAAPDGWIAGSEYYEACVSPQPDVRLAGAVGWLLRYPYGCAEQTTSASFPLLYLADLANRSLPQAMGSRDAEPYVTSGIYRLLTMQRESGGFAMWPDARPVSDWAGTYATHFLVEAKRAGFAVPEDRLRAALDYLAGTLDRSRDEGASVDRAYICQVLALAGRPERGWTARLLERAGDLSAADRTHLAAALLSDGRPREARSLLAGLDTAAGPAATGPERTADLALALAAWLDSDPSDPAVPRLVHALEGLRMRGGGWWSTTHDTALALLALGRYARLTRSDPTTFAGELRPDGGEPVPFASDRELRWNSKLPGAAPALRLVNRGPGACWYTVRIEGVPVAADAKPEDAGLAVRREFHDAEGRPLDAVRLKQGTLVVVKLTLDTRGAPLDNLVIEDLLPAGWEVENPALATSRTLPWLDARTEWCLHRELRDDRVLLFTGAVSGKAAYYYAARAVTPGVFALPPVRAEAMYRPEVRSLHGGGRVEVVE